MPLEEIKIRTQHGVIRAVPSGDPDYPGIWVEYIDDEDTGANFSKFQTLMETEPATGRPRILIWDDPESEDYITEINMKEIGDIQHDNKRNGL